jgi:hypothetical protein
LEHLFGPNGMVLFQFCDAVSMIGKYSAMPGLDLRYLQ